MVPLDRFTTFPIEPRRMKIWSLHCENRKSFWLPNQVDPLLENDRADFNKMTFGEQTYIREITSFFVGSDGIIKQNLGNLRSDYPYFEYDAFYNYCSVQEDIHGEAYSKMMDTIEPDPVKKHVLMNSLVTNPVIKEKAEWALSWMGEDCISVPDDVRDTIVKSLDDSYEVESRKSNPSEKRLSELRKANKILKKKRKSRASRLFAHAIQEGIGFQTSFLAIIAINRIDNRMQGFARINRYVAREENIHLLGSNVAWKEELHPSEHLSTIEMHEMVDEYETIEEKMTRKGLSGGVVGLRVDDVVEYTHFIGDNVLKLFGKEPCYRAHQPFPFMEKQSITDTKDDFFKTVTTEYELPGSGSHSRSHSSTSTSTSLSLTIGSTGGRYGTDGGDITEDLFDVSDVDKVV